MGTLLIRRGILATPKQNIHHPALSRAPAPFVMYVHLNGGGHFGVPHQSRRLPYVRSDDGGYRWGTRNHFDMQNDLNILLLPSRG
jgi:hypothetical protein